MTLIHRPPTSTPDPSPQGGGEYGLRRGACPGLSAPMPTGDGLLVRLHPTGTIPLAAFAELCRAARRHGNGVIEITSRGSIQVRGLSDETAPQFALDIAALDIAAADGVPILCDPLFGIDAEEIFDSAPLAADLRRALTQRSMTAKLSAKVSVAIDGGGAINLANISADIRLCAHSRDGNAMLAIAVGGDDANAAALGSIAAADGAEAATRLLDVLARHGRDARARDLPASEFRSAIADLLSDPALDPRLRGNKRQTDAIGMHRLRDGSFACGIGLAFGHADASALERLVDVAAAVGASGFRAAPCRALMTIGLSSLAVPVFVAAAGKLGFIVRADDPQRSVVACAGAPSCAAAHIAARALAPVIASQVAPLRDDAFAVHISGCAKGCAHAGPAALTVVGTPNGCALVGDGSVRDAPFTLVTAEELLEAIARFARQRKREVAHV